MSPSIRTNKHPHEVALLTAALVLGVAGLVAFDKVSTVTVRSLPDPYAHILYAGVAVTAAVSLTGVSMHNLAGLLIERAGLAGMALLMLAYAGVVFGYNGIRGLSFVVFVGAFAAANVIRVLQIRPEIDQLRAVETIITNGGDRPWSG